MTIPEPASPHRPESIWKTLWPLLLPHKGWIIAALSLNALHGIAITFQTLMPKYLIDWVLMERDIPTAERWRRLSILAIAYLLGSIFGRMLVWHMGYRIFTRVREAVVFALRAQFFRHLNHLCLRFHRQHNSGELFTYLFGSPLQQLQQYLGQFTLHAPGAVFTLCSTLIWIGLWDWAMTLVLLVMVVLTVLVMNFSRRQVQHLQREFQQTEGRVSGYVADLLRGSRDVKLYAMEEKVAHEFEDRVGQIRQKVYERDVKMHIQWMKQETVGYFCFALLCTIGTWRYLDGHITIGQVPAYLTSFIALQGPLNTLFQMGTFHGLAQAGLDRIDTVLKTASTTPDPVGYEAALPRGGDILLVNVHFGYEPDRPVLKDINLRIPYGQKVAIVGPSGGGKSTLSQLLLRLYDPESGAILIGGLNIRHCRGPELRKRFGVVPQDPFIFRTTIRENLTVVKPDADDASIRRACQAANAWEFIARMPQGLDTPVGESGATLSGGQRQRLAIARALLSDPDFFIFDEATSALDTLSEQLIQDALAQATSGRTTFIIAHRLATVKHCDRILVIQDGQVLQDGSYDQLVHQTGLFRELVEGQKLIA